MLLTPHMLHAPGVPPPWRASTYQRHVTISLTSSPPNQREQTLKQAYFQEYPRSTLHVQVSIDSRNFAIHSAYRSSLRPSSLLKPRHPLLNVVRADWLNILHGNMVWEPQRQGAWQQGLAGVASAHPGLSVLEALLGAGFPSPGRIPHQQFGCNTAECVRMILPQVHLQKPCYDFSFL